MDLDEAEVLDCLEHSETGTLLLISPSPFGQLLVIIIISTSARAGSHVDIYGLIAKRESANSSKYTRSSNENT